MQIKEIMSPNAVVVHPDSTLQEAAEKMKDLNIGVLPVTENERLVGVLTDRDITVRCVSEGQDPWTDNVGDAMTRDVISCFEEQDVAEAARLMKEKRVRRVVVLDRDRQVAGIVSLGDLAEHGGTEHLAGDVLYAVSEPVTPAP